mmetsp:Transcript_100230/g.299203  ORF Transcript_100230/g.299203 Transcript_100230/m.299203 type:complete len:334 (+) Transcript_100230:712-1713(+)
MVVSTPKLPQCMPVPIGNRSHSHLPGLDRLWLLPRLRARRAAARAALGVDADHESCREAAQRRVVEGDRWRQPSAHQGGEACVKESGRGGLQACVHERALILEELSRRQGPCDKFPNMRGCHGRDCLSAVEGRLPQVDLAGFGAPHVPDHINKVCQPQLSLGLGVEVGAVTKDQSHGAAGLGLVVADLELYVDLAAYAPQGLLGDPELDAIRQELVSLARAAGLHVVPHVADRLVGAAARTVWPHELPCPQFREHLQQRRRPVAVCARHLLVDRLKELAQLHALWQCATCQEHVHQTPDDPERLGLSTVVWHANHNLRLVGAPAQDRREEREH